MVTCRLAGIPIEAAFKWIAWMIVALTAVLLLVSFVPELVLFLPRYLGYL
jgi:TRAP-type C4-dicarboxylate transport system permease large subunit